jgi:hypothetical protein
MERAKRKGNKRKKQRKLKKEKAKPCLANIGITRRRGRRGKVK